MLPVMSQPRFCDVIAPPLVPYFKHVFIVAGFNFVGHSLKLSTYRKRLTFEIKIWNMEYVIFIFYSIYTLDLKRDKAFLCCGQSSLTLIVSTVS